MSKINDIASDLKKLLELKNKKTASRDWYLQNGGKYATRQIRLAGGWSAVCKYACVDQSKNATSRHLKRLERGEARADDDAIYHEFMERSVLPHSGLYWRTFPRGSIRCVLSVSDVHCVFSDPFAVNAFYEGLKCYQPDTVVLAGDILDCYEMSKFPKDSRLFRIKQSKQWLDRFISTIRNIVPLAEIVYIPGNHELRILQRMAEANAGMREWLHEFAEIEFRDLLGIRKHKITFVSKIDLAVYSGADAKRTLKENYTYVHDSLVVAHEEDRHFNMSGISGHTHKPTYATFNTGDRTGGIREHSWLNLGCLCETRAEYVDGRSTWQQGFGVAYINPSTGDVAQHMVPIQRDFAVVGNRLLKRKK